MLHIIIKNVGLGAFHSEKHAFQKAFDVGVGFPDRPLAGIKKVAFPDRLDGASDVTGIVRPEDDTRPANNQAAFRGFFLPTRQDQFGSQLGDAIRGIRLGQGGLIGRARGGPVRRNAGHKKDVFATNLGCVAGHVDGSLDIGLEILLGLMTGLSVNGGQ